MTATTTPPLDTRDMVLIHTFVRREFRLAGSLVRRVAAGDTARAAVVADHLELVTRFLHHHHTIEDEHLWPLLLDRVPDELAPVVHLMESQHATVEGLLAQIDLLLPRWRPTAAPEARDRLGDVLDELYAGLSEHLDAEEQRLLPLAATCVTPAEWARMGAEGRRRGRSGEGLLVLGMFGYEGDPEVLAHLLAAVPAPVRAVLLRLSRRAFRRHALAVHGTATP